MLQLVRNRASSLALTISETALPPAPRGLLSIAHATVWQTRGEVRSPMLTFSLGVNSVPHLSTGSAPLCCPGKNAGPALSRLAVDEGLGQLSRLW